MRKYINPRASAKAPILTKAQIEEKRRQLEITNIQHRILVGWKEYAQKAADSHRPWVYICNVQELPLLDSAIANLIDEGVFDGYHLRGYLWGKSCSVKITILAQSETNLML